MQFIDLAEMPENEIVPGFLVRFVHTDNMSFAHWTISEGAKLPEHSHPHEQVANILEGQFEITIDGVTKELSGGCVAVIPSNAVHSGRALTPCRIIDAFYPTREDYRT